MPDHGAAPKGGMTGAELDSVMRYFGALFARWPQSKAAEVLVAYGGRIRHFDQAHVREAIEELAEGSLLFPTVQEFVEACSLVKRRNLPEPEKPKRIEGPKRTPLQEFVASMRAAGVNRPVGSNEAQAFRWLVENPGAKLGQEVLRFVERFVEHGTPAMAETYATVDEFLAHEGYAVR